MYLIGKRVIAFKGAVLQISKECITSHISVYSIILKNPTVFIAGST